MQLLSRIQAGPSCEGEVAVMSFAASAPHVVETTSFRTCKSVNKHWVGAWNYSKVLLIKRYSIRYYIVKDEIINMDMIISLCKNTTTIIVNSHWRRRFLPPSTHMNPWNSPQTMLIGAAEALEPLLLAGGVPIMTGNHADPPSQAKTRRLCADNEALPWCCSSCC